MADTDNNVTGDVIAKSVAASQADPGFTKDELMGSRQFSERKDLVAALLEDGRTYTKNEAESLISAYLKKEVV